MTDCDKYRELLSANLDGELTGDEEGSLERHLAGCKSCSKLLAEMLEQRKLFSRRAEAKIPVEIEKAILDRTSGRTPRRNPIMRLFSGSYLIPRPVAWAVAALIVTLIALDLFRPATKGPGGPAGSFVQSYPGKIHKIVITDDDIVKTQTFSDKGNL